MVWLMDEYVKFYGFCLGVVMGKFVELFGLVGCSEVMGCGVIIVIEEYFKM